MKPKTNSLQVALLLTALPGLLLPTRLLALDLDLKVVGSSATSGNVTDVAISGNLAYVVESWGLVVLDISDSANLMLLGSYTTSNHASTVAVSGNYAFIAGGGLEVIDISNPSNLQRVGAAALSGWGTGVVLSGNHAYLAEHPRWDGTNHVGGGLHVFDISDATDPRLIASYGTNRYVSIAVSNNLVYAAESMHSSGTSHGGSLDVIEITNPSNPLRVGRYLTVGSARHVVVADQYVYLAEEARWTGTSQVGGGLVVIDINEPSNPRRVGGYDGVAGGVTESESVRYAQKVAVAGNHACVIGFSTQGVTAASTLDVIDITNPVNPQRVGGHGIKGQARGVAVSGNFAYVAEQLWICDIMSNPPCELVDAGLRVVDFRFPANPQRIGNYQTAGWIVDIAVSGDYAYLAETPRWTGSNYVGGGIQIVNISDPVNAVRVGSYPTNLSLQDVEVAGNYAYVVGGTGMIVIDISDPTAPYFTGDYDVGDSAQAVALSGRYGYVADYRTGLHVIDVSNPANPQGMAYRTGSTTAIEISGNYAYLAEYPTWTGSNYVGGGLQTIDISDPTAPRLIGAYPGFWPQPFAISGSYAYLTRSSGLDVIDIRDPANPHRVGGYETRGLTARVAVSGNYAYLIETPGYEHFCDCFTGGGGLHVIDVSNPANPRRVGGNSGFDLHPFVANAVTIANGKVFVAAGSQGLIILHEYQPIRFEQVAREDSGAMRLQLSGPPGVPGRVQRSADLRNWTDWRTLSFGESPIEISDSDAANSPAGFYRLAVP